jgi:hypothetical protein
VFPALLEFPLPPAVALAEGDAVCANAWVTPTPPIANPLASAAARAVLRIVLVISITSFRIETQHIERS